MAYARPHYGHVQRAAYAHPEPLGEPQQERGPAVHDHGDVYQNYDNYHESTYDSTQYRSDNYYAPHDGLVGRAGDNGHYGGTARNGDTRQGGDYWGPTTQQPHSRPGYDERHAYREPRAHPPPQPNYHSSPHGTKSPLVNQHQQKGPSRGPQRTQAKQDGYYQDLASHSDSTHADRDFHRNDQYYEPREDQKYQTQRPQITSSKSAEAVNQRPPPAGQHQPQVYTEFHGNGAVQGDPGGHNPGSAPRTAPAHGQRRPTPPKLATAQLHQSKGRILGDPTSPDTLAWDNPFPTFPTSKKKANQTHGDSLNAAVAGMDLHNDTYRAHTKDQKPSTANSKGSKSSSFSNERRPNVEQMQDDLNPQYQTNRNAHDGSNGIRYNDDENQYNPQAHGSQVQGVPHNAPKHRLNVREEWPIPHDTRTPAITGRRSEDANASSSFRPHRLDVDPGSQRSRTMPNAVAKTVMGSGPNYAEPSWQEPGPIGGYYGPNDKEYLPNNTAQAIPPRPRPSNDSRLQAEVHSPVQSSPYQARSSAHPMPHGAQDSIGDLFDSYYDAPHHDLGNHGQSRGTQPQFEIDEDMPDFDAIPESGTIHRRGMTIDEHLEPQPAAPAVPPIHTQYRGPDPGYLRTGRHSPGQVPRSRSSPNLKQPRSPKSPHHADFNFDMPEVIPAVPTKPLPQYYDSYRPPITNAHPNSSQQNHGQQARPYNDRRPAPPAARSPGNGVTSAYGAPPRSSQDRVQYGQHQLPHSQNARPNTGHSRTPDNRMGPTSPIAAESRPASAPSNPDALPRHPAPVRPGLMQGSPVNQAPKPAPVRLYNTGSSSLQQVNPIQPPDPSRASTEKPRNSVPITHEELDRLRQIVARSPSDQQTQLVLAKKMVEAASLLVDQRTDHRTRAKTREKYILDAHKIVKKLVNNGYPDASFYLADCYNRGFLGLEIDPKEAFNLYQSAAKAGHPQAAYRVAVCCEMGQEEGGGTKRDPLKAMQWYKRAATLGDTPAMYKMGIIQLKGLLGQTKNPNQAVTWLKRAADRADEENPHALHELGLLHEKDTGNEGVIKDEGYSKQLFTQAAKLGYKFSQFRLGCAYEYGLMGCPVDPRQSIAWYSKAAVQEEHQSELALSGWYLTGSEGVLQQSDTEAYLWARKAAQAGLAKAEYAMGYFTEVGIGAPANLEDAKRWYWRAASQNFPKARDRLEDLRKGGAKMEKSRVSRSAVNKQSEGDCVVM